MPALASIEEHVPAIRSVAESMALRCRSAVVGADDFFSVGCMAFERAASRYDSSHGCSLRTYAMRRAQGAMLDELRRVDWVPRQERTRNPGSAPRILGLLHHVAGEAEGIERSFLSREVAAWEQEESTRVLPDLVEFLFAPLQGRDRLVAERYFLEGTRMRDIGDELGVSMQAVHNTLRNRIRPVLERRAAAYVAA